MMLRADADDDDGRDILKSDSAYVEIPELELELQGGTLGGVFTTVEGLLLKILNSLSDNNPFMIGTNSYFPKILRV